MNCKICAKEATYVFSAKILNKYDVKYFQCKNCEYFFTENPFWLSEAYKNPINLVDTGIIQRNIYLSQATSIILFTHFNRNKKFLDYAGGYGIFTRLMRDIGIDFYWQDDFTQNLLARGFEMKNEHNSYELLTAFEVFEHFENPVAEVRKMLTFSDNILFSTVTYSGKIPSSDWWYYGFEHGQHISFFSPKTLSTIASILNLKYSNLDNLHLFSRNKKIIFNSIILKILTKLRFDILINFKLKSKTFSDHLHLKNHIEL
jgi:2-polyprenyl-3-methyl-5-hydroxy-6-metoxy-1,4-benzoquinol methylase